MALQSPAPTLKELSSSLDKLEQTLDVLLARPLGKLGAQLEAGSSSKAQVQAEGSSSAKKDTSVDQAKSASADKAEGSSASAAAATTAAAASDEAAANKAIELAGKLDAARLHSSAAYVLLDLVWSECMLAD